jgi:hypothetical protein
VIFRLARLYRLAIAVPVFGGSGGLEFVLSNIEPKQTQLAVPSTVATCHQHRPGFRPY